MGRIQVTGEISKSLRGLRKASGEGSSFKSHRGFYFVSNETIALERLGRFISRMGQLGSRYYNLLKRDARKSESLIEAARQRDVEAARVMGGSKVV